MHTPVHHVFAVFAHWGLLYMLVPEDVVSDEFMIHLDSAVAPTFMVDHLES